MIIADFETRSIVNLPQAGTYMYASHPSTDIICCAFIDMEDDAELLIPSTVFASQIYQYIPDEWVERLNDTNYIAAHNAEFDMLIWEYIGVSDYGFPEMSTRKWYCTSAQCRVNALPGGLDDAGRAIDNKFRKDVQGKALIRKLCIPNKLTGDFCYDRDALKAMGEYCLQDVRVTQHIINSTRMLTPIELNDWHVNQRINDTGIKIDRPLAAAAMTYADAEQRELGGELEHLTGGVVCKHTQSARARDWLLANTRKGGPVEELMRVPKKKDSDETRLSLDKNVRNNILTLAEEHPEEVSDDVYAVIEILNEGSRSSVAKFTRMGQRADLDDDRARGSFVFAGAGQTQRYASRGLQLHNMRRDTFGINEAERIRAAMMRGVDLKAQNGAPLIVMDALSKMLRPCLIPADDHIFVVGDWSAVEGRALPWLSDSKGGDKKLDLFESGVDIYVETATAMGNSNRQIGKVAELSLGYGGSIGAFKAMGGNYGLSMQDHEIKKVVAAWRDTNSWAVDFWGELERAAKRAYNNPGATYKAGAVGYMFVPELLDGTLVCELPGGYYIQYPKARIELEDTPYGAKYNLTALKASFKPAAASSDEWPRMTLWGGFMAENVTQAFTANLLKHALAMWELRYPKYPCVGHVHDEIITEVRVGQETDAVKALQTVMESTPEWALGLPLKAEPTIMRRYGK